MSERILSGSPIVAASERAQFHHMLDEYEKHLREMPARIDACKTEAGARFIIKTWLSDDLDYDLIVAAWERKEDGV